MRRTEEKYNGTHVIIEEFKDFRDLERVTNSRPFIWGDNSREVTDEEYFRKCSSYGEAQSYLLNGYNENVDKMVKGVHALQKAGRSQKIKRYADVVGFTPIVPNAIMGLPTSMLNQKKVQVQSKIITIVCDIGVSGGVKADKVLEFGCKLINCIMNLEKNGYRVRLDVLQSFSTKAEQYWLRVPLKNENQPVNIKRLSFPLTHVAFLRYICFDWVERLPKSKELSGYGYPVYVEKQYRDNIEHYLRDNEVYIDFKTDIDEVFGQK